MDSHTWRVVYQAIREVDRRVQRFGRRTQYSDVLIVAMYLWSVEHDRPLCWACGRSNYGSCFRPRRLPSVSQFCRRIKSDRCQAILQGVHDRLSQRESTTSLSFLDGRALTVGPHSKDAQATRGWGRGRFDRGYRLHAWATEDGRIPLWSVTSLNVSEKTVAKELLHYGTVGSLALADAGYDSSAVYDAFNNHGVCLLTKMQKKNAGMGHRRQSPARLAAAHAWQGIAGYVHTERNQIERYFGQHAVTGGGLGPLPGWVRTLERVRRWVGAKLILYHARLSLRHQAG